MAIDNSPETRHLRAKGRSDLTRFFRTMLAEKYGVARDDQLKDNAKHRFINESNIVSEAVYDHILYSRRQRFFTLVELVKVMDFFDLPNYSRGVWFTAWLQANGVSAQIAYNLVSDCKLSLSGFFTHD